MVLLPQSQILISFIKELFYLMRSSTGFSGSTNGAHRKYQNLAPKSGKGK